MGNVNHPAFASAPGSAQADPDVQRVFVEGIASRLSESSRVIAAGKIPLIFTGVPAAGAGAQVVHAPGPLTANQMAPLGVFDMLPSQGEPQHFTTLQFPGGQQNTFMEQTAKAYSGHVRLMLAVEMANANTLERIPQAGEGNQAAAKSVLARGIQISPVLGAYTNTMDFTVGEPNTELLYPDCINAVRTALPEVTNYLLSNGSYEIDLAEFSAGSRFVSVGLHAWETHNPGIAAYPSALFVYYYAVDMPAVGNTKAYPQAWARNASTLQDNAGGIAAQGYTDNIVLWSSGGNASQVTSISIYNGTTQSVDVDCRMFLGAVAEPMLNVTPAVPAIGPAVIASGASALYVIEQVGGGGSTINPSSVVAFACPAAAATGTITVAISGE